MLVSLSTPSLAKETCKFEEQGLLCALIAKLLCLECLFCGPWSVCCVLACIRMFHAGKRSMSGVEERILTQTSMTCRPRSVLPCQPVTREGRSGWHNRLCFHRYTDSLQDLHRLSHATNMHHPASACLSVTPLSCALRHHCKADVDLQA